MRSLLACSVVVAGALALAPVHRRVALAQGGSFLVAMPGLAAGNAEAAKVKQSQAELKEILGAERNFQSGVLAGLPEGSAKLPTALSFVTFQKLEKVAKDPDAFMEGAIEYAEASRNARDLIKLALIARRDGLQDVAKGYYDRALPEIREASSKLDALVLLLP